MVCPVSSSKKLPCDPAALFLDTKGEQYVDHDDFCRPHVIQVARWLKIQSEQRILRSLQPHRAEWC